MSTNEKNIPNAPISAANKNTLPPNPIPKHPLEMIVKPQHLPTSSISSLPAYSLRNLQVNKTGGRLGDLQELPTRFQKYRRRLENLNRHAKSPIGMVSGIGTNANFPKKPVPFALFSIFTHVSVVGISLYAILYWDFTSPTNNNTGGDHVFSGIRRWWESPDHGWRNLPLFKLNEWEMREYRREFLKEGNEVSSSSSAR